MLSAAKNLNTSTDALQILHFVQHDNLVGILNFDAPSLKRLPKQLISED